MSRLHHRILPEHGLVQWPVEASTQISCKTLTLSQGTSACYTKIKFRFTAFWCVVVSMRAWEHSWESSRSALWSHFCILTGESLPYIHRISYSKKNQGVKDRIDNNYLIHDTSPRYWQCMSHVWMIKYLPRFVRQGICQLGRIHKTNLWERHICYSKNTRHIFANIQRQL